MNTIFSLLFNEIELAVPNSLLGESFKRYSEISQLSLSSTSIFALSTSGGAPVTRNGIGGTYQSKFDARRKTGLLPAAGPQAAPRIMDNGGGGATYVIGGGIVRTSTDSPIIKGFGEIHGGRGGKRKRRMEEKELEEGLKRLLERDGKGGSGSVGAQYLMEIERAKKAKNAKDGKTGEVALLEHAGSEKKRPFAAHTVRRMGFDPTNKTGMPIGEDATKRVSHIFPVNPPDILP